MWKHLFLFFWVVGLHQQSAQSQTFQYASSVLGFSSEYNSTDPSCSNSWAACRALGEPDVFPNHGDSSKAWAPRSSDNQREFIQLGFSTPIKTDSIFIYETYNPGAIDTIYLRNAQTQTWEKVW
ncbi:MAG: hypothetical protein MUF42_17425, partial [Cytophagaceae bacterium]|nr:hypothetical protein [Cytophagaceae bacterium]